MASCKGLFLEELSPFSSPDFAGAILLTQLKRIVFSEVIFGSENGRSLEESKNREVLLYNLKSDIRVTCGGFSAVAP